MISKLEALLNYYEERGQQETDMIKVIGFALFSTRRPSEIVEIKWDSIDEDKQKILIKNTKETGVDIWCHVPDEAWAIIKSISRRKDGPFPYTVQQINASFSKACKALQIKNLQFYDLRPEGIARLFAIGWDTPKVAAVLGHSDLATIQKHAQLIGPENKYSNWVWVKKIAESKSVL